MGEGGGGGGGGAIVAFAKICPEGDDLPRKREYVSRERRFAWKRGFTSHEQRFARSEDFMKICPPSSFCKDC